MDVLKKTIASSISQLSPFFIGAGVGFVGLIAFYLIDSNMYDGKEHKARMRADVTATASAQFSVPPPGARCTVLKVVDSNSVILRYDNKSYAARLGGVNCPTGSSELGRSAKKRLIWYLTDVAIEDWVVTIAYNSYARRDTKNYLICDLYVKPDPSVLSVERDTDKFWINYQLVRSGFSRAITDDVFYFDVANSLRAAEHAAANDRRGIWEGAE
jgi:endonuclease YncB( thermonuclease family)